MARSVSVHHWGGIQADVWTLDSGEKIARHKHEFMHSTGVVRGRTRVTLFGDHGYFHSSWEMNPGDQDIAFDPLVEHEIEAIKDGTVIVNLSRERARPRGETGKTGGLMLDTGEVIHDS